MALTKLVTKRPTSWAIYDGRNVCFDGRYASKAEAADMLDYMRDKYGHDNFYLMAIFRDPGTPLEPFHAKVAKERGLLD